MPLRLATSADRPRLVEILTAAFLDNPSTLFAVRSGPGLERRMRRLIRYSVRVGLRAGGCYLSDDGMGAAILFEGREKPENVFDTIGLVVGVMGLRRIAPVLRKERYVSERHPTGAFVDLWFLGVGPQAQGRGVGSAMLNEIIAIAEAKCVPVYLETSRDRTVRFYEQHGFEVYDETDAFGFPFRCLRRESQSSTD